MAEVKNYGLSGVHRTLQLGKQGPVLVGNADTDSFTVTLQDAATLTTMGGANASSPEHFITKAQLDVVYTEAQFLANVNYNSSSPILLGNITAGTKTIITTFEVDTAFDGNAVITVGTGDDNSLLMSDSYAEIEVTGSYQTTGLFEFASDTSLNIYVTQGGATAGTGKIIVSVVDGPVVNGGTINYGGVDTGIGLADLSVTTASPSGNGSLTYNNTTGVFTFTPADLSSVAGNYGNSNVVTLLSSFGSNSITTTGNITAGNISGNISITGNVVGTSTNVTLVAGSYSATMDNTGFFSAPTLKSTNSSGDEGGELQLAKSANATISTGMVIDSYNDRIRIFEAGGNARGVHIDLTKAPAGVAGELLWKVSGFVNAGTFLTMDNLKVSVTTSGNRGLSIGAVSTNFTANVSGWHGYTGGFGGDSANNITYTTTASSSAFGWAFTAEGDSAQYNILDKTNNRFYRVTLMIGASYNSNFISIERIY